MPPASRRAVRFVRAVITAGEARPRPAGGYEATGAGGTVTLADSAVRDLVAQGVLSLGAGGCRATAEALSWLKRQLLAAGDAAARHRTDMRTADGTLINLAESPLGRLAIAAHGETAPFLQRHQVEAGERVRRLAEQARLMPRLTMNYSGAHRAARGGRRGPAEIGELAADARAALAEIHRVLPADCAGVVLDVCGLLKGLQLVEAERGWPRRSAKLVLRIGLEQLAQHYGLAPLAVGGASSRRHAWLDEGARPLRFE
ncbi:DUF6456 domain-containing protein [Devosia sp.]|uniref:DUF6456 domain-containing protein n=1 Tax=Devosia sp. TaxID=1871048 RepID=UPI002F09C007